MSAPVILVAVSGGIAAYKSADLVSRLRKRGADVHVLMTDAATKFVGPLTFEALSGRRVHSSVLPTGDIDHPEKAYPHLYPSTTADAFVVAPATADVMARLAAGMGDDAVTAAALSLPAGCRRYFAPAMNVEMWRQPVVQRNVGTLEALGWVRIGPDAGELACGMTGEGRMSEPELIADTVMAAEGSAVPGALKGRRVLILSGPTCEHIDPIRFISNASSGRMGRALAEEASRQGAQVVFVTGPVPESNLPSGASIAVEKICSADNLLRAGRQHFADSDVVVYAAAVADYRPASYTEQKLPKQQGAMTLELESTPDVAATLNEAKREGQVAVGFALQTHDGEKRALEKMRAKKFDGIVLNSPDALGGESGTYTFFDASTEGTPETWGALSKRECARRIFDFAAGRL